MTNRLRLCLALFAALWLAACNAERDLAEPVVPLGDFKMGHIVIKIDEFQRVDPSRNLPAPEWQAIMDSALKRRFGRYTGDSFFHIGMVMRGYSLAIPAPLVSPKSVLIVDVTVFDNKANKMEPEPKQFTILESFGTGGPLGSGLTLSKEEQAAQISANTAKRIEEWMREYPEFFGTPAAAQPAPGAAILPAEVPPPSGG